MASRAFFTTQLHSARRFGVRYQTNLAKNDFVAEREAIKHHAADAAETWRKIALFVCIPALLASGINAYNLYRKHQEHAAHHPKEWVKYEYINWRARDFFWGREALLFNPKVNLPASEEDQ
ncbi:cytochrome c oxidase, subunit VIa [Radiomyces spectabilis]|uniref:cytochrome c oxidase, subunit VIa n=1 Tax=Radiomyces spectabilis TaxID=64574 RepID=UPI00221EF471|nr:cytochrome c oxidase, subunit VIa [Radiomyces spectabilis]KAI8376308.1 cytochrome c oxidase, subunit VIa [Radiomyces spectabilis]